MTAIGLLDLDGTVADYDVAMHRELNKMASPCENNLIWDDCRHESWMEARRDAIARRTGFWRDLPERENGMIVYRMMLELGYEVHVLSKGPGSKPDAWSEKFEWARAHLPEAEITITESKSGVYGTVLVDDWSPYFIPWMKNRPRGLVIIPDQPWNKEFTHPNAVRDTDMDKVREALIIARDRKDKEPLILPWS